MFDDVVNALRFSTDFENEELDMGGIQYKAVPFSNAHFKPLTGKASGSIAFIDGGNAELLHSPNFSLQLCRIAYCIFENNKRTKQERKEFYALVTTENKKFVVKTFGADFNLSFDISDEHFKQGVSNGTPSSVVNAVRRFAELKLASSVAADVVVLDGSLQQKYPFEDMFLKGLEKKNVVGFSKTCSLLTKSGNSVVALMGLHPGAFIYHPVVELLDESYKANICFARLHEKSSYVFKIDFNKEINRDVLALLSANAQDPVFLGYPYGLVLADKLARVSNDEAEFLKTKFMSKIKNKDLIRYLNALNAHNVLDRI